MISVIVPVYNVEKYLSKCIDSIIHQTYVELEIVLVVDGSADKCSAICDHYLTMDSRIQVIHKKNGGVSSARNIGIQASNGDYICFVDSDDWLPRNSIELLFSKAKQFNADLVYGGMKVIGNYSITRPQIPSLTVKVKEDAEAWLSFIDLHIGMPWAQLFKKEILDTYNIRFPEQVKVSEDTLFVLEVLAHCEIVCSICETVYIYNCFQKTSAAKRYFPEHNEWKRMCIEKYKFVLKDMDNDRAEYLLSKKAQLFLSALCEQCVKYMHGNRLDKILKIAEAYEMIKPYISCSDEAGVANILSQKNGAEIIYDQYNEHNAGIKAGLADAFRVPMQHAKYYWYYKIGMS